MQTVNRVYFVSDVHLRAHFMRRASFFTAFLHSIRGAAALYMLGDIFDYWVGVGQLRKAIADPVFQALRMLHESGTELFFIAGNRDFLVGRELTRTCGVRVLGQSASIRLGRLNVHLSHGDQFCTRDHGYMLFRTGVRNPLLGAVFKHLVPLFVRVWAAKLLRRSSKAVVRSKPRAMRDINLAGVKRRLCTGFDVLICGHVHESRHIRINAAGAARELYTLGHWDDGPSYLVYEAGKFTFVPPPAVG
jgi:UDP-2,3-diacylglucosamine hydrolase